MTPAEERVAAVLDRWLESVELHLEYASLDDEAYWRIRKWVEHDRPVAWVVDVARKKVLALRELYAARDQLDSAQIAEALELTIFLANLVGSEHVQRFIPLVAAATAESRADRRHSALDNTTTLTETTVPTTPRVRESRPAQGAATSAAAPQRRGTRANAGDEHSPDPSDRSVASGGSRSGPPRAHARTAGRVSTAPGAPRAATTTAPKSVPPGPPTSLEQAVMADAVRLLGWGRDWHELAEAIARMSGRPPLAQVRQILRDRRKDIEARAASAGAG